MTTHRISPHRANADSFVTRAMWFFRDDSMNLCTRSQSILAARITTNSLRE